ncbi:MAG TPA: hypothetical protein VF619_08500 [Allosphingosinicella sp.]|jgi:hypothetical protein
MRPSLGSGFGEDSGFDQAAGGLEGGALDDSGGGRKAGLVDLPAFGAGGVGSSIRLHSGIADVEAEENHGAASGPR